MKKVKYLIITIVTFLISSNIVLAAGTGILSTNVSSIENGGKVTATLSLKNVAAWNVSIRSSGATSGCTEKFVGDSGTGKNTNKTFSVVCKATSIGIINFSISGDITSSDGVNVKLSGSRNVKVVTPRAKSTNNKLKSLSISDFELKPTFDSDVKDYELLVPSTTEKININAIKADTYASIEGNGEKTVDIGVNTFEIIVTSETGVSNIYTIKVIVEDLNPIEVKIGNETYTVVKEAKNLKKPDLFDETTIKINDFDIPAFKNDLFNYTLVGLKDNDGKITLYIYSDGEYTRYKEFISEKISVIFLDKKDIPKYFKKTTITINEEEIKVLKHENLILIFAKNIATGEENYYRYDANDKTIQIFDVENYINTINKNSNSKIIIYILSSLLFIITIIGILLSVSLNKYKKIEKKIEPKKNETEIEPKKSKPSKK